MDKTTNILQHALEKSKNMTVEEYTKWYDNLPDDVKNSEDIILIDMEGNRIGSGTRLESERS